MKRQIWLSGGVLIFGIAIGAALMRAAPSPISPVALAASEVLSSKCEELMVLRFADTS